MTIKYRSFQDLPLDVTKKLKKRMVEGGNRQYPAIPEDASMDERMCVHREAFRDPDYTKEELEKIVEAFILFNNAVKRGLPNQLYLMMTQTLDSEIAQRAHAANTIWYAHEDDGGMAKEAVQKFADEVKAEIDRRTDWDTEQFHKEYLLGRK